MINLKLKMPKALYGRLTKLMQYIALLLLTIFVTQTVVAKDRIRYHISGSDGSTLRTVDEKGIAVAVYRYAPFGEQLQSKKPANLKDQVGFVGGIHEQQDLVYLKHRYYNPLIGRFYQPDPIGFIPGGAGQINHYQYGGNDTYTFKDPSGLYISVIYDGQDTIHIMITVQMTGNLASAQMADDYKKAIMSSFNGQFGRYNVTTQVDVLLGGEKDKSRHQIIVSDSQDDPKAILGGSTAYINLGQPSYKAAVLKVMAHETGHLFSLRDEYVDTKLNGKRYTPPRQGYAGSLMAQISSTSSLREEHFDQIIKASKSFFSGFNNGVSKPK